MSIARLCFANDPTMTSYKLEMISQRLDIELDDAHDADADVTACLNVVRVYSNRMRNETMAIGGIIEKKVKTRKHFKI